MLEENAELIGYCGLYCGDCPGYKGKIADMARDLVTELAAERFDELSELMSEVVGFEALKDYSQCVQVLTFLEGLRCDKTCREDCGNPACGPRQCCRSLEIPGCWECAEFETCKKLDFLKPLHGEILMNNLRKLRDLGVEDFLNGEGVSDKSIP